MEAEEMEESKQILVSISALQANMDNLMKKVDEIGTMSTQVIQNDHAVKRAHERIDEMQNEHEKDLDKLESRFKEQIKQEREAIDAERKADKEAFDKFAGNATWLQRSILTVVLGLVVTEVLKLI